MVLDNEWMANYMASLVRHIHQLARLLWLGRSCDLRRAASVYPSLYLENPLIHAFYISRTVYITNTEFIAGYGGVAIGDTAEVVVVDLGFEGGCCQLRRL